MFLNYTLPKYTEEVFTQCSTGKSEWICKSCHTKLQQKRMPVQAQANSMYMCPSIAELNDLCPLENMLISQIIPFMSIIALHKGAQQKLKGHVVLVPTDLKKLQRCYLDVVTIVI